MARESLVGDIHVNCYVDSFYQFASIVFFSPAPSASQTKLNNNHQKQATEVVWVNLPFYLPHYLFRKEFIDNMRLKSPTCVSTWTFIFIKASSPEDNKFVDTMEFMSPTCFSTLLVTRIGGQAWETKEGFRGIGKIKEGHSRKLVVESGRIPVQL
jgi:hypothetical protein